VCKKKKGEANHWFLAQINNPMDRLQLTFTRWSHADARNEDTIHLCGQECAQRKLSEFLGSLT